MDASFDGFKLAKPVPRDFDGVEGGATSFVVTSIYAVRSVAVILGLDNCGLLALAYVGVIVAACGAMHRAVLLVT